MVTVSAQGVPSVSTTDVSFSLGDWSNSNSFSFLFLFFWRVGGMHCFPSPPLSYHCFHDFFPRPSDSFSYILAFTDLGGLCKGLDILKKIFQGTIKDQVEKNLRSQLPSIISSSAQEAISKINFDIAVGGGLEKWIRCGIVCWYFFFSWVFIICMNESVVCFSLVEFGIDAHLAGPITFSSTGAVVDLLGQVFDPVSKKISPYSPPSALPTPPSSEFVSAAISQSVMQGAVWSAYENGKLDIRWQVRISGRLPSLLRLFFFFFFFRF